MGIGENFNRLADSANDFAGAKIEELKLSCIENISLLVSEFLSMMLVFISMIASIFFALIAVVTIVATYIGFLYSVLMIAASMALISFVVYLFRKELFANIIVRRLCNIFFMKHNEIDDEKR